LDVTTRPSYKKENSMIATNHIHNQQPVSGAKQLISLSKTELALQYSPNLPKNTALMRLMRWIKGDRDLYQALIDNGCRDTQRVLNIKQLAVIYEYLGEPDCVLY